MAIDLPVFRTTKEALTFCWHERRALVRVGAAPLALVIAVSEAAYALIPPAVQEDGAGVLLFVCQLLAFLPLGNV